MRHIHKMVWCILETFDKGVSIMADIDLHQIAKQTGQKEEDLAKKMIMLLAAKAVAYGIDQKVRLEVTNGHK